MIPDDLNQAIRNAPMDVSEYLANASKAWLVMAQIRYIDVQRYERFGSSKEADNTELDKLARAILNIIFHHSSILPCDFMLWCLDRQGHGPSLISDDGGNWAVSVNGDGPAFVEQFHPDDELTYRCKAVVKTFKKTIREALACFIEELFRDLQPMEA